MGILSDISSIRTKGVTPSDLTTYAPCLLGLDVYAPGNVTIKNGAGESELLPFPTVANGGCYPYRYWGRIYQVLATGTDVGFTSTNLKGVKHGT